MENRYCKPLISVIIPIYNTKEYLEKCLTSACSQTYSNLEIICVDDGSSDGSEKMVDEFAKKDNRIIVFHQENRGESAARNVGLRAAKGDYITFMDCDDWIEKDMYEGMINSAEYWGADLVACGYFIDTDLESKPIKNEQAVQKTVFGRKELFHYVYVRDQYRAVTSWLWCKLFKKELLFSEGEWLQFDESIRFGADLLFFLRAAEKVKAAYYISTSYYHYRQRETSTSHTQNLDIAFEIVEVYQMMIEFCKKKGVEVQMIPWLQRFKVYRASLVAEQAYIQNDIKILEKCQKIMEEYKNIYLETNKQYPDRIKRYQKIMAYKLGEKTR